MGISSSSLGKRANVVVSVKPTYKNKGITNKQKLAYFKKEISGKYVFGIPGCSFKIKSMKVVGTRIVYEITYTSLSKNNISLSKLRQYVSDGFHKETTAGNPKSMVVRAQNVKITPI